MTDVDTAATPLPDGGSEEHRFPCEACGSDLRFDPAAGQLVCDHCGNTETIVGGARTTHALKELDFRAALADLLPLAEMEETRVVSCPNCGAQVEFDATLHAAECPFCATPVVTDTGVHRHIKPRGLLPFAMTEGEARAAVGKWLGNLWFAPNGLQQYARKGRRMNGLYLPYWTFDADTKSRYRGQRGTVYHESRQVVVNGKRTTQSVRKVRWTPASGRVARFFDDVLVVASHSLPAGFRNALGAWDLSSLEPYRPEFLAGFRAEGYAVPLDDAFVEARAVMDRVIERDVKFDIGGDVQQVQAIETDVSGVTFKHILLPIWLAAYKYRGKTYRIAVNGRSGQVAGERPYSAIKIALAVVAVAILAGAAGYVIALEEGMISPSGF
jgi:DNA-directed RNA polymerase subunit RPC12/RpoP